MMGMHVNAPVCSHHSFAPQPQQLAVLNPSLSQILSSVLLLCLPTPQGRNILQGMYGNTPVRLSKRAAIFLFMWNMTYSIISAH